MAEEKATSLAVDAQTTTAPEATPDTKTDAPTAPTEANDATTENKDTEMTDPNPAVAGEQATTEATAPDGRTAEAKPVSSDAATVATPASAKGKRKSTGGVPEHKKKQLNKKKSMASLITNAQPGDYYFAKFKGYAPWPSIICDESMLPETLLATRPVSTENSQGELREDYKEGGKNAKDRTYPVMFLETNEFAWIVNSALTPLNPGDAAEDKLKPKMAKSLLNAYALAEERHDIDYYKGILQEHEEQEKIRREEIAQKEAEKQEKAAKKQEKTEKTTDKKDVKEKKEKRKSTAKSKDTVSDEDDMDIDEKPEAAAKPSKKRKKDVESEGDAETPKPKKTPKTIKIKAASADKTPNGDSAKKVERKKKVVAKPAEEKEEKEVITEEQRLERREKAVLYLRHRLQKGFLSRDQAPKEDEMETMSEFFTQLESYADLEPQVIRVTKINKVLKGIVKLASIPKEDEYKFKKRSNDLLGHWNNAMDQNKGDTTEIEAETKTNGDVAEKADAPAADAAKEPVDATPPADDAKEETADAAMTEAPQADAPAGAAEAALEEAAET